MRKLADDRLLRCGVCLLAVESADGYGRTSAQQARDALLLWIELPAGGSGVLNVSANPVNTATAGWRSDSPAWSRNQSMSSCARQSESVA